jgi:uncharacterized membrane protein
MVEQEPPHDPRHPVQPPPPPEPLVDDAPPARYARVERHEIAVGKPVAFLCYLFILLFLPFFLIPLVLRRNEFVLFHAKQSVMLWVFAIVATLMCYGFIFLFGLGLVLFPICVVFIVALAITGMTNVVFGRFRPLPFIGAEAERSLAGIHTHAKRAPAASS